MDNFHALVYGTVEGLTEFLPISSTGHLILTRQLLRDPSTEFIKTFEIAIQLGAILAVVATYWRSLLVDRVVMQRVLAAFLPIVVLGLLLYGAVKQLQDSHEVVLWSLGVGGLVLILFEWLHGEKSDGTDQLAQISYPQAILVGLCQSLAMLPGVSRAAATVVGGLAVGIRRRAIVEFSFLLAVPTMAAATGLDLAKNAGAFSPGQWQFLLIGFVTSFLVALLAIRLLLRFIKTHTFVTFGLYRILLAVAFWWFGLGLNASY
jgi:undecaprenyl-diphosphatase